MSDENEVPYEIHSMMVKAVVDLQPTKLEMLDSFEESVSGHIYSPPDENIRVVITGRDWNEKNFLIYGCTSLEEAEKYVNDIVEQVRNIGHEVREISQLTAVNIAVNGNLHEPIRLENLFEGFAKQGVDVEYEPEQFPGLIVHLEDPSVTFLIFSSGKFVIQGVKAPEQIEPAIYEIKSLMEAK